VPANSLPGEVGREVPSLACIIQTSIDDEAERSVYCPRRMGFYLSKLMLRKKAAICRLHMMASPISKAALAADEENKILERELRRKEKAAG